MTSIGEAVAAEVRAEVAAQGRTARWMQGQTGIKSRTWENYFVNMSTPVPLPRFVVVCDVLGVPAPEMLARAVARARRSE